MWDSHHRAGGAYDLIISRQVGAVAGELRLFARLQAPDGNDATERVGLLFGLAVARHDDFGLSAHGGRFLSALDAVLLRTIVGGRASGMVLKQMVDKR
jgi:hypothetical protein